MGRAPASRRSSARPDTRPPRMTWERSARASGSPEGPSRRVRARATLAGVAKCLVVHLDDAEPRVRRPCPDQLAARTVRAAEVLPQRGHAGAVRRCGYQAATHVLHARIGVAAQQLDLHARAVV